jgi:ribonuclease Z
MSVEAGLPWTYAGLHFHGLSLSGIRTSMAMPQQGICFDVAQGFPFVLHLKKYFLTHGHLDHAAGIPYIISQKMMNNAPTADFYMPESLVSPMDRMMAIWQEVEKHQYRYHFHAISEHSRIDLNPGLFVRPFKTVHRVDSFGYSLIQTTKKLKKEFSHLQGPEIIARKKAGAQLEEIEEKILVSFTGDTQIDFLDVSPQVKKSKILFLETTYVDEKKSVEHARTWGHTHLDELIPRLSEIESERIVLIHVSSRYSTSEILKILKARIPANEQDRVVLFPGR